MVGTGFGEYVEVGCAWVISDIKLERQHQLYKGWEKHCTNQLKTTNQMFSLRMCNKELAMYKRWGTHCTEK